MDLLSSLTALDAEVKQTRDDILVCPNSVSFPDDGVFDYIVASDFFELVDLIRADRERFPVFVFDVNDDLSRALLEFLVERGDLTGRSVVSVDGVPNAQYSVFYSDAIAGSKRTSYHALYANVAEEVRRAVDLANADIAQSDYLRRRKAETRSNNTVKEFVSFDKPTDGFDADIETDDDH